jgi:YVTN family beta-propeller protein
MAAVAASLMVPSPAAARDAYVTGTNESAPGPISPAGTLVGRIDLATQTTTEELGLPEGGEGSPSDIAITPDGGTAYVVNNTGGDLLPIDIGGAAMVPGTPIPLDNPKAVAITPDGTRAYVSEPVAWDVAEVDLTTGTVGTRIPVGEVPTAIAITPDGARAYVADEGSEDVSVIDLATRSVIKTIPVGERPDAIAITPDGARAYVSDSLSADIKVIAIASDTVIGALTTSGLATSIAIAPDGAKAYEVDQDEQVIPIDITDDVAAPALSLNGFLEDVAIAPDGSRAYVVGEEPDGITPIDVPDDSVGSTAEIVERPDAIAIVPNQPPHAAFTSSPVAPAPGSAVSFDATGSFDPDGSVARYEWEFGDGATATSGTAGATHTYAGPGTYQVTLTETDDEGCSTRFVFTGQTAYCNGSGVARVTHPVTVAVPTNPAPPTGPAATSNPQPGGGSHSRHGHHHPHHPHHRSCVVLSVGASSFVPERRPGHVVPGVRLRVAPSVPGKVTITATLLRRHGQVGLGKKTAEVRRWRRMRFVLPPSLRGKLPYGTPARVKVTTTLRPKKRAACVLKKKQKPTVLDLHVVRVFPRAVQSYRGGARQAIWNLSSRR